MSGQERKSPARHEQPGEFLPIAPGRFSHYTLMALGLFIVRNCGQVLKMKSLLIDCRWLAASLLLVGGLFRASAAEAGSLSADEIVRKVLARAQTAREDARRGGYTYTKHVVVQDLDNQGRVTETKEKLFKFSSGLGSLEQVKVNGQSVG